MPNRKSIKKNKRKRVIEMIPAISMRDTRATSFEGRFGVIVIRCQRPLTPSAISKQTTKHAQNRANDSSA